MEAKNMRMNKIQGLFKVILSLVFLLLAMGSGWAKTTDVRQNRIGVEGRVTSATDGTTLIGVSIVTDVSQLKNPLIMRV